ncbi:MAG: hypothetical protein ABI542_03165 [Gemmatimonadota bacterium]
MMHAFKYHGWRRLAESFAAVMERSLAEVGSGPLVPVPTDPQRTWRRGYDQAAVLTVALGNLTGRQVLMNGLHRSRRAGSQVRLTPEQRLANLAGVFRAGRLPREVVLVDDVFTTGATLLSAAGVLRGAGVAQIGGLTFARAEPPLAAAAHQGRDHTFFGSERF